MLFSLSTSDDDKYDSTLSVDPLRIIICSTISALNTTVTLGSRKRGMSALQTSWTAPSSDHVAARMGSMYFAFGGMGLGLHAPLTAFSKLDIADVEEGGSEGGGRRVRAQVGTLGRHHQDQMPPRERFQIGQVCCSSHDAVPIARRPPRPSVRRHTLIPVLIRAANWCSCTLRGAPVSLRVQLFLLRIASAPGRLLRASDVIGIRIHTAVARSFHICSPLVFSSSLLLLWLYCGLSECLQQSLWSPSE